MNDKVDSVLRIVDNGHKIKKSVTKSWGARRIRKFSVKLLQRDVLNSSK